MNDDSVDKIDTSRLAKWGIRKLFQLDGRGVEFETEEIAPGVIQVLAPSRPIIDGAIVVVCNIAKEHLDPHLLAAGQELSGIEPLWEKRTARATFRLATGGPQPWIRLGNSFREHDLWIFPKGHFSLLLGASETVYEGYVQLMNAPESWQRTNPRDDYLKRAESIPEEARVLRLMRQKQAGRGASLMAPRHRPSVLAAA